MKPIWSVFTLATVLLLSGYAFSPLQAAERGENNNVPSFSDEEINSRLQRMKSCLTPKLTAAVKSYLRTYTVNKRDKAEKILGRTTMYFPMFEKYLSEQHLPLDLKYLSVVESALIPTAVSRSRAVGLWQFMSFTAKDYHLQINRLVDERRDPHKSTQAAALHLKSLYKRFGNWELALAAYNGGAGRVGSAVKRARSKNFWRVSKYLPRETANYVPAFIAASYLLQYYHHHKLIPQYPELDKQLTETIRIYDRITFQKISEITGASTEMIEELNPAYLQKFIPSSRRGHYLILPQPAMAAFRNYKSMPDSGSFFEIVSTPIPAPPQVVNAPADFLKTFYTVKEEENIFSVAKMFGCTPKNIQQWNRLGAPFVAAGQVLIIYQSRAEVEAVAALARKKIIHVDPLTVLPLTPIDKTSTRRQDWPGQSIRLQPVSGEKSNRKEYIYYQIKRGESLVEIAEKFPNVTLREILELNKIKPDKTPRAGKRIKLKQL